MIHTLLLFGLLLLPTVKWFLKECPDAWAAVQLPWNILLTVETLVLSPPILQIGISYLMHPYFTIGWLVSVLLVLFMGLGMVYWCFSSWRSWWNVQKETDAKKQ